MEKSNEKYALGLDIGSNSIGWATLKLDAKEKVCGIINAGSRVFEAGMDGDISSGKAESRNATRRDKRLIRRQLWRRRRRLSKLFNILQDNNLLPAGDDKEKIIAELDKNLYQKYSKTRTDDMPPQELLAHTLPYYIRARALYHNLEPYELGRAIYHLAHRRGFFSNRKMGMDDSEAGVVKQGISELQNKINTSNAKTLGEYFAHVDPHKDRIRSLWTSRQMYIDEFKDILSKQKETISDELQKELYNTIFYQRKLKSVKNLIGHCVLEPTERRCPWYRFEAQRFRILQQTNNLRVILPGAPARELNSDELYILVDALEGNSGQLDKNGNLTIAKAKKILTLPKGTKFSIEEGGEKFLKGNKTNSKLSNIFEDRWESIPTEDKEDILLDLISFEKHAPLVKRAMNKWGLSKEKAEEFSNIKLEEEYCNLSLLALYKILPDLEEGHSYSTVVKKYYPEQFTSVEAQNSLPRVELFTKDMRNPVVSRTLTEVRKVVNSIIRIYGKPEVIRIEVARDLKSSNKEKASSIKRNRDNEKDREAAKKLIFNELRIENPSRDAVLKVLLAEECNWECPYTQKKIGITALLVESQFDIEHIIPFSRCLDNSYANKTLCFHQENRNVKKNQTPYEAYSSDRQHYDTILASVKRFKGRMAPEKLRRFELNNITEFEDFSSRQLNDTRYASKLAMQYLGTLYGGINDDSGKKRIQAITGGITYFIRAVYGLNNILGDGVKSRDDHRHHAVDAIAIAMTSPTQVNKLSSYVKDKEKSQLFGSMRFKTDKTLTPSQWSTFHKDVREKVKTIITSHHVSKKVRGALHEETLYGQRNIPGVIHIRKSLDSLTKNEISKIADDVVRKAVTSKLEELAISDPSKAFSKEANRPVLYKKDGSIASVVKKVRLKKSLNTIEIGAGKTKRNVVGGNNHHMEIVAILDQDGKEVKWEGHVVSLFDAKQRMNNGKPIVKRNFGESKAFKFSIARGDLIGVNDENNNEELYWVTTIETKGPRIWASQCNDARLKKDRNELIKRLSYFKENKMIKYSITPTGVLQRAND